MTINKKTAVPILVLLVLLILGFSLMILYWPDAGFFYREIKIDSSMVEDEGQVEKIYYGLPSASLDPNSIQFFINVQPLTKTTLDQIKNGTSGTYAVEKLDEYHINIYFIPVAGKENLSRNDKISIKVKPYSIKSDSGGEVLVALVTIGLISFFIYLKKRSKKTAIQLQTANPLAEKKSPLTVRDRFEIRKRGLLIRNGLVNAVLISYLYIFLEWLYYISNPSFMEVITPVEKAKICLIIGFLFSLTLAVSFPILYLIDVLLASKKANLRKYLYSIPAAFLAAFLCLSLLDNITYVYLKFGIVSSERIVRAMYALIFVVFFLFILDKLSISTRQITHRNFLKGKEVCAYTLCIISLLLLGMTYKTIKVSAEDTSRQVDTENLPNIIILATDGLSANNMSVYGYSRDTTPFLSELAKTSLVSENNFTNATTSMGSETSILTGKSPFSTRVIFTPDTLRGIDMYQSLPNILKQNGYRTASLGVEYFVDVNAVDFRDAFDEVNCHKNGDGDVVSSFSRHGFENEVKFFDIIQEKIESRLLHIAFIKDMEDSMANVTKPITFTMSDTEKANCLNSYLDTAKRTGQPLFVQVHLMGTHGPTFDPSSDTFSKGEEQSDSWMTDYYDDAILDYDGIVQNLVQQLKDNGQYENTVLVLYTDHPQHWVFNERTPLIIHFPDDQYAGTISDNTQNLDIAPTILDYINVSSTYSLGGESILDKPDPTRLIIAGIPKYYEDNGGILSIPDDAYQPPFYQFTALSVVECQKTYLFDLAQMTLSEGEVKDYVNPCDPNQLDSTEKIKEKVGEFLITNGYKLPATW